MRTEPHRSAQEHAAQARLAALLAQSPIPPKELPDNLSLYQGRRQVTDLLAMDALYRMILNVPGVVMEFRVRWGRHLGSLTALRALHEPFNVHRRILAAGLGQPAVREVVVGVGVRAHLALGPAAQQAHHGTGVRDPGLQLNLDRHRHTLLDQALSLADTDAKTRFRLILDNFPNRPPGTSTRKTHDVVGRSTVTPLRRPARPRAAS